MGIVSDKVVEFGGIGKFPFESKIFLLQTLHKDPDEVNHIDASTWSNAVMAGLDQTGARALRPSSARPLSLP
jgi:hypothetical protein